MRSSTAASCTAASRHPPLPPAGADSGITQSGTHDPPQLPVASSTAPPRLTLSRADVTLIPLH